MRTMVFRCGLILSLVGAAVACGSKPSSRPIDISSLEEAWNANNDPLRLADSYQTQWSLLPLSGRTKQAPWTDSYWPNYRGGLADRWNDPDLPDPFSYVPPSYSELEKLSETELSKLSPAEKYDVFLGLYAYPLLQVERRRTSAEDPSWFGLCHGWAPAALHFAEPKPVVVAGRDGHRIPFGSSDIKALLSYAQQNGRSSRLVGERCNLKPDVGGNPNSSPCRDINAGSFHIILANQIGLMQQGFVAEINRYYEVWNHPVHAFDTKVVNEFAPLYQGAAADAVRVVSVSTSMRYITELGAAWERVPIDVAPFQEAARHLEYFLELDRHGQIVGGKWISENHPDFLWTQEPFVWEGYFAGLKDIYEASLAEPEVPEGPAQPGEPQPQPDAPGEPQPQPVQPDAPGEPQPQPDAPGEPQPQPDAPGEPQPQPDAPGEPQPQPPLN